MAGLNGRTAPPLSLDAYDFGPAFALANKLVPVVAGMDLRLVATSFAIILGNAESTMSVPNPASLQHYVSEIIGVFASKNR